MDASDEPCAARRRRGQPHDQALSGLIPNIHEPTPKESTRNAVVNDHLNPIALAEQAAKHPTAVAQRTGHLVEQMGIETDAPIDLQSLHSHVDGAQVANLYPATDPVGARDWRWNVIANIEIKPDL